MIVFKVRACYFSYVHEFNVQAYTWSEATYTAVDICEQMGAVKYGKLEKIEITTR